jgi:hypothetical protein
VESAVDHTLAPHVENLLLTGSAINGTGNALDNTLAGNALDNVLAGGDGTDTYRFARQSGNDLLIDSGANRIELESGLTFADLIATRDGDDLLLAIRRDTGSLRLQGYFTDATPWQAVDAAGNTRDTETLLADTAAYEEDRITTLARDFLADTRLAIEQNLTAQGLARQANGTWARTTQSANNLSVTQTEEFTTTTYTGRFNNGVVAWTSTGTSHDVHWTQPGTAYRSQATASILQSRVSADGAEVHASGGDDAARHRSRMKSRRWRHGERRCLGRATNDAVFEMRRKERKSKRNSGSEERKLKKNVILNTIVTRNIPTRCGGLPHEVPDTDAMRVAVCRRLCQWPEQSRSG